MPTLPGRATSILAVLDEFSTRRRRTASDFDWPALVEQARPGTATEAQRRQQARLSAVHGWLTTWIRAFALPADHVEECALFTITSTSSAMPEDAVNVVAATIYWIYVIDDFLDLLELRHVPNAEQDRRLAQLDSELQWIFQPLISLVRPTYRRLLGKPMTVRTASSPEVAPLVAALHDALGAVVEQRQRLWAPLPQRWGQRRFRQRVAAEQLMHCVAMMRQELDWNLTLVRWEQAHAQNPRTRGPRLPTLRNYLCVGVASIGMPAVAAVVAGCERRPRHAWRQGQKAIEAAGRVVRLTNDLHTYEADIDTGKLSSVAVQLHRLGYAPSGWPIETSIEVQRARVSLAKELAHAIDTFAHRSTPLPSGLLREYLRQIVAFALAVYGDGGQFRGEDSRSQPVK
jgi:hypothetical protein